MNPKNRTLIIIGAAVVLILALAGVAMVATGGDDDAESSADTTQASGDETRPVELTGEALPAYDRNVEDPAIGVAAPVINGQTFDGTEMTIGGATGQPTLLVFLAHWCPHCNDEVPEMIELDGRGGFPEDLDIIGVSTAVDPSGANYPPSEWVVEKGWPWPIMADDAESSAFLHDGGSGFPYMVLLDAEGNVIQRASGTKSADDLETWLTDNLATTSA